MGSSSSFNIVDNIEKSNSNLKDYLLWQLDLTPFSENDKSIAFCIIDYTNEDGFLIEDLSYIKDALGRSVSLIDIKIVMKRLQHFDPIGVCCRSLVESLCVQLTQLPESMPYVAETKEFLANMENYRQDISLEVMYKKLSLQDDVVNGITSVIKGLNPKPGRLVQFDNSNDLIPDVMMCKQGGSWKVRLNPLSNPRLFVNKDYAGLLDTDINNKDYNYIKSNLQDAKWFIKSLDNRNDTLLRVAQFIVDFQNNFFLLGEEAMRPMVLSNVADSLGLHGSTISRITTKKYIHTPKGVFELKYFFSSQLSTSSGDCCSSIAIRALIKKIIGSEDPVKPLSDSKISSLLAAEGVFVARRTVAKYRESMMIDSSVKRKIY